MTANWDDLRQRIRENAFIMCRAAADDVRRITADAAPVGDYPDGSRQAGQLRDSIVVTEPTPLGDTFLVTISSPLDYALFTDVGTAPHEIWGKRPPGYVLSFYWAAGPSGPGVYHFSTKNKPIQHPGTTGTDWFGTESDTVMASRWTDALDDNLPLL